MLNRYMLKDGEFARLVKKGMGKEHFKGDNFIYCRQALLDGLKNISRAALCSEVLLQEDAPFFAGKVKVVKNLRLINASSHLLLQSNLEDT